MSGNESFDKMANALDSTFADCVNLAKESEDVKQSEISPSIENEIQVIQDQKNELVKSTNKNTITLKDKEYIEEQIKFLIDGCKDVFIKVKDDIKIGTPARQVEVFAKLADSITNQLKELRDLNKMVSDMELMNDALVPEEKGKTNVNINMTGKDLLEILKRTEKESQLQQVDAVFEVEDEK